MIWVLIVLFVDRGLLIDRPAVWVSPTNFSSYEECESKYQELIAAYPRTARSGICRSVKVK